MHKLFTVYFVAKSKSQIAVGFFMTFFDMLGCMTEFI